MYKEKNIPTLVKFLGENGVEFGQGLSATTLHQIERYAQGKMPRELRELLSTAQPLSDDRGREYARWDIDIEKTFLKWNTVFKDMLRFDIENNHYWNSALGSKPADIELALSKALDTMAAQPKFIPLDSTNHAVFAGLDDPRVVSYHGPADSVAWPDIYDYYYSIYAGDTYKISPRVFPEISFWDKIFGWNGYA